MSEGFVSNSSPSGKTYTELDCVMNDTAKTLTLPTGVTWDKVTTAAFTYARQTSEYPQVATALYINGTLRAFSVNTYMTVGELSVPLSIQGNNQLYRSVEAPNGVPYIIRAVISTK